MKFYQFSCLLFLVFSSKFLLCFVDAAETNGITVDLIHRHSKLSPFHNQSATAEDLLRDSIARSLSRRDYYSGRSYESWGIPNGSGDYVIRIFVGTPPVERFALADTGSELVWFQCAPCPQCYQQDSPLFEPTQSYTYGQIPCYSTICQGLPQDKFGCARSTRGECAYNYPYGDLNSYSRGVISTDTISMETTDGQLTSFPNFVFGCGHQNQGTSFNSHGVGLVGLNRGPLSLISQMHVDRFAYCLASASSNSYSQMTFGGIRINDIDAYRTTGVVSTPLITRPGDDQNFYYVNLGGATVAGRYLVWHNERNPTYGNMLLDSGTQLTYLEPEFYYSLETAVRSAITLTPLQVSENSYYSTLCYNEYPEIEVVFHFTGADVTLKPVNLFLQVGNKVCFSMVREQNLPLSIFGNVAQMNFHIEHDLANKLISFAPADCSRR